MEGSSYDQLIKNLESKEKVDEALEKDVDAKEIYKRFKEYYYRVSHEDYYAAKKFLDDNVELKKSLRLEMAKLENLKDKPTLTDPEREELKRIERLMEEKDKTPDSERILIEKIIKIEDQLHDLKIAVKENNKNT